MDVDNCTTCKTVGTVMQFDVMAMKDIEVFCPVCIGGDGHKQHAWRLRNAKRIIDSPDSVRVTLVFKDQDAKEDFMGGLSDGWGENHCQMTHVGDEIFIEEFDEEDW